MKLFPKKYNKDDDENKTELNYDVEIFHNRYEFKYEVRFYTKFHIDSANNLHILEEMGWFKFCVDEYYKDTLNDRINDILDDFLNRVLKLSDNPKKISNKALNK